MGTYVVARKYSHTDKRKLWKIESREFTDKQSAINWMDYLKVEEPKHEYFIVEIH